MSTRKEKFEQERAKMLAQMGQGPDKELVSAPVNNKPEEIIRPQPTRREPERKKSVEECRQDVNRCFRELDEIAGIEPREDFIPAPQQNNIISDWLNGVGSIMIFCAIFLNVFILIMVPKEYALKSVLLLDGVGGLFFLFAWFGGDSE